MMHSGLLLLVTIAIVAAWPAGSKINKNALSRFAIERIEKLTGADGEARKTRYQRLSRRTVEKYLKNADRTDINKIRKSLKRVKHDSKFTNSIIDINEQNGISEYLFEGDMELTDAQLSFLESTHSGRTKRQVSIYRKWTNNQVYYEFDGGLSSRMRTSVKNSLAFLEANTCIRFTESNSATNRIKVYHGAGCLSGVSMLGGVQGLSLDSGCSSMGTVVHEFFHALGIWHMQMRPDRDVYVTVDLSFVHENKTRNYDKLSDKHSIQLTPYDYGSTMHYDASSFADYGNISIIPKDIDYLHTIGSGLVSITDLEMVNKHYGCDEKCPAATSAQCKNKGFPNPNNCTKCICPLGYGGDLCDQRPADSCGETLTASDTWQTATKTIGQNSYDFLDTYTLCTFWITTDPAFDIEVKVTKFFNPQCSYGCSFNGIEVKLRDEKLTSPRICCEEFLNETRISTLKPTPVILYNSFYYSTVTFEYRRVPATATNTTPSTITIPTTTWSTTTLPTTSVPTTSITTLPPTTTTPGSNTNQDCIDTNDAITCARAVTSGDCTRPEMFRIMKYNCAATCGLCGKKEPQCRDHMENCSTYISTNLCKRRPPLCAEFECAKTCGFCENPV